MKMYLKNIPPYGVAEDVIVTLEAENHTDELNIQILVQAGLVQTASLGKDLAPNKVIAKLAKI